MERIKFFVYWVGNPTVKIDTEQRLLKLKEKYCNIDIEFGPTKSENEYLSKNFKFYKINMNNKKYAFTSDLWRIWKLSENNGIYIDATTEFNIDKIDSFLDSYNNNDLVLIKENGHLIWNGLIASKDKELFKEILNFYMKFPRYSCILTGPKILSLSFYKKYGTRLNNENVKFYDARDIDPFNDSSIFQYNGMASWKKKSKGKVDFNNHKKTGGHNYFHKNSLIFQNGGYSNLWIFVRWLLKNYMIYALPYVQLKNLCLKKTTK